MLPLGQSRNSQRVCARGEHGFSSLVHTIGNEGEEEHGVWGAWVGRGEYIRRNDHSRSWNGQTHEGTSRSSRADASERCLDRCEPAIQLGMELFLVVGVPGARVRGTANDWATCTRHWMSTESVNALRVEPHLMYRVSTSAPYIGWTCTLDAVEAEAEAGAGS